MPIQRIQPADILNNPAYMEAELSKLSPRETYQFFDDFTSAAIVEAESPYIFNAGSDDLAIDPAPNVQAGGVLRLTGGDGDGAPAVDGSQVCLRVPVTAAAGGLAFEARLKIAAIADASVFVGFTDSTSLEEPMSVATATLTTTASDAVGFVFDPAMTAPAWWLAGVDTNVDAVGSGSTGVAPANGAYQTLRVEVSADGTEARGYIDGVEVGTLSKVVTPATALYFTVFACGDGANAAATTVDVDYVLVEHAR